MMMESPSSNPARLKLQVVIATETADGQVHDLRKFLHITQRQNDIALLITEVNEKFRSLYPSELYLLPLLHSLYLVFCGLGFAREYCGAELTIDLLRY